jgi:hypothetical protein
MIASENFASPAIQILYGCAPLEPNRAAINQHLYALFHPDFVMAYPDAWIEIACGLGLHVPAETGRHKNQENDM